MLAGMCASSLPKTRRRNAASRFVSSDASPLLLRCQKRFMVPIMHPHAVSVSHTIACCQRGERLDGESSHPDFESPTGRGCWLVRS